MRSEACLPDNFGSFVFAPVVNIFFDFMRLKFVFICREKAYLAPDWGASGMTLLVANAVNATLPQTQLQLIHNFLFQLQKKTTKLVNLSDLAREVREAMSFTTMTD